MGSTNQFFFFYKEATVEKLEMVQDIARRPKSIKKV